MKLTIKLILVICLFTSAAFADGDMGNGGRNCQTPCLVENQPTENDTTKIESDDSISTFIQEYLDSIFR